MSKPKIDVYTMHEDCAPHLAVVRMSSDDEELWLRIVADHAQEWEWRYGLDEAFGPEVCQDGTELYDDAKVVEWCRKHIEPPKWQWHCWYMLPPDDRDEDFDRELSSTSGDRPNRSWWRGANVILRRGGDSEQ